MFVNTSFMCVYVHLCIASGSLRRRLYNAAQLHRKNPPSNQKKSNQFRIEKDFIQIDRQFQIEEINFKLAALHAKQ